MATPPEVVVHPQFRQDADLPGDVLIRCRDVHFFVHKAVIYFASPFFSAILDGGWSETDVNDDAGSVRAPAMDEVGDMQGWKTARSEVDAPSMDTDDATRETDDDCNDDMTSDAADAGTDRRLINARLVRLDLGDSTQRDDAGLVAVIDLSDDDPSTLHDVLHHIYPNLELLVTWNNLSALLVFNRKYLVPHLQRACATFLTASLAGKPIEAMAVSERHGLDDIYREASRHVLDNMAAWEPEELAILTTETLLKLERKRTWFVERLLKLGLASPLRDFVCHATCTDRATCAVELEGQWRVQYAATISNGPPQPSVAWHCLRELGGSRSWGPSVKVGCQAAARSYVQNHFDRMYGLPSHSKTPSKFLLVRLNTSDVNGRPVPRERSISHQLS